MFMVIILINQNCQRNTKMKALIKRGRAKEHLNFDWSKTDTYFFKADEATIYLDNIGKCWYKIGCFPAHPKGK